MEKATRGRPGKVNVLPEDIRKRIFTLLREKRITQRQILDEVNRLIEAVAKGSKFFFNDIPPYRFSLFLILVCTNNRLKVIHNIRATALDKLYTRNH